MFFKSTWGEKILIALNEHFLYIYMYKGLLYKFIYIRLFPKKNAIWQNTNEAWSLKVSLSFNSEKVYSNVYQYTRLSLWTIMSRKTNYTKLSIFRFFLCEVKIVSRKLLQCSKCLRRVYTHAATSVDEWQQHLKPRAQFSFKLEYIHRWTYNIQSLLPVGK